MPYRVENTVTGVAFEGDDVQRALQVVLADHSNDDYVRVAIDLLTAATARGDEALATVWATALKVTITAF